MSAAPAIETRDLCKSFGERTAVAGLTLRVERGEVFGFLGPNGAGKTTVVKMLVGLVRPSGGDAALLGAPLGTLAVRRKIGYLPELFRYQDWLTAREVLGWHARLVRVPRRSRRAALDGALERVGLGARSGDLVGTFSKGMQQRLGIAVALVGEPDLLFLDEPSSALDPLGRAEIRALVLDLRARGTTVFLNSHLLSEVEHVCDRVAIIDAGRIVAAGNLEAVLGRRRLRVRFAGADAAVHETVARAGGRSDGDLALFDEIEEAGIPPLVRALVEGGARIVAVEPARPTLEERFLELLRDDERGTGSNARPA